MIERVAKLLALAPLALLGIQVIASGAAAVVRDEHRSLIGHRHFAELRQSDTVWSYLGFDGQPTGGWWRPSRWRSRHRRRALWLLSWSAPFAFFGGVTGGVVMSVLTIAAGNQYSKRALTLQIIGALLFAVICWIISVRGLVYLATPNPAWGSLIPPVRLKPSDVPNAARDRFILDVYWRTVHHAAVVLALSVAFVAAYIRAAVVASQNPRPTQSVYIQFGALFGGCVVAGIIGIILWRTVNRVYRIARVLTSVMRCLYPLPPRIVSRQGTNNARLADPLAHVRGNLRTTARLLARLADHTDRGNSAADAPHPVAVLLRGTARSIRRFLASSNSLDRHLTDDLTATLRDIAVVLAGPRDPISYRQLASLVAAFDGNGDPDAELIPKSRSRIAVLVGRVGDIMERTHRGIISLTGIATLVILILWLILHRPSLESVLQHIR